MILIIALVTFVDVHILRGYFLVYYFHPETFQEFDGEMDYQIERNMDGTFNLQMKNKTFSYIPIILYRTDAFINMHDSVLFSYANRFQFIRNGASLYDTGGGFDCGTDIGAAYIRPYESFKLENLKLEEVLPEFALYEFETDLKEEDIDVNSLNFMRCRLYLSIYSFGDEDTRVYSNEFEITIQEIINARLAIEG